MANDQRLKANDERQKLWQKETLSLCTFGRMLEYLLRGVL